VEADFTQLRSQMGRYSEFANWKAEITELKAKSAVPVVQEVPVLVREDVRIQTGMLLAQSQAKVLGFGVSLTSAKLVKEVKGPFDMEEFVTKIVKTEVKPTLLLLE
jgi:hypothetical protein